MIGRRTFLSILAAIGFARDPGLLISASAARDEPAPGGDPDRDPLQVLQEIREHVKKGEYAEALSKHIWYHENAVRIQPAQYGVRLSFALSDWVELGQKYPRAREALRAIRDKNHESLGQGKGSVQVFHDLSCIDRYLGDQARTVETFRLIRTIDPNLAAKCYVRAEEALVDQGAFDVCLEFLGDPQETLSSIAATRTELLTFFPDEANVKRAADANFTTDASRMITILAKGGQPSKAESVREAALKIIDNETLRNAGK